MDGSHGPQWASVSVLWKPHTYIPSAAAGVGTIRHDMPQVSWQRMYVCMHVCIKDVFNVSQQDRMYSMFPFVGLLRLGRVRSNAVDIQDGPDTGRCSRESEECCIMCVYVCMYVCMYECRR